jgi:hypothetical protein
MAIWSGNAALSPWQRSEPWTRSIDMRTRLRLELASIGKHASSRTPALENSSSRVSMDVESRPLLASSWGGCLVLVQVRERSRTVAKPPRISEFWPKLLNRI